MFHSATDILIPITDSYNDIDYVMRERVVGHEDYDYAIYKAEDWTDFDDAVGLKHIYFLTDFEGDDIQEVFDNYRSARTAYSKNIRESAIEYGDFDDEEDIIQVEDDEYDLIESKFINEDYIHIPEIQKYGYGLAVVNDTEYLPNSINALINRLYTKAHKDIDNQASKEDITDWVKSNKDLVLSAIAKLKPITISHNGNEYTLKKRLAESNNNIALIEASIWTRFIAGRSEKVYIVKEDYEGGEIFEVTPSLETACEVFNEHADTKITPETLNESKAIDEDCTRINLRDELNKLDCEECDGEYVNLYDAANLNKEDKKTLAEMLCGGKVKSVKPFLTEAYIKTIRR